MWHFLESEDRQTPGEREPSFAASAAQLLMIALFASLSMLFGASVVAVLVTRGQNEVWRTAEMPTLPASVWLSTLLLVALSAAMEVAKKSVSRNRTRALNHWLVGSLALALVFLASQSLGLSAMIQAHVAASHKTLYAFSFQLLVGLHAAHVLGGVVPLGVVLYRNHKGEYSSSRYEGVRLLAQYWHYLGVVWLILLAVLFSTS